jgi:hypothetical protein
MEYSTRDTVKGVDPGQTGQTGFRNRSDRFLPGNQLKLI